VLRLWGLVDKRALVVTVLCLAAWRLLGQIPLSDVSHAFIAARLQSLSGPGFFAAIGPNSIPFRSYSVIAMGLTPYITALVTMNLLMVVSANIRGMAAHPGGRFRLTRWTRGIALLFAMGQAYGYTVLFQNTTPAVLGELDWSARLAMCIELTGGTAILILLADVLDEHGLGFGYGAVILYAIASVGTEVHRIGAYIAYAPSVEALYLPLAWWAAFTIGITAASVGILLAVRRRGAFEVSVLRSGVLRPPQIVFGVMFLPTLVANYTYPVNSSMEWLRSNWSPYGGSPWVDGAYLLVEGILIVLFAVFVAAVDNWIAPVPSDLTSHLVRLAAIGGLFLAVAVTAAPELEYLLTRAGTVISVSGFDVVLVVAMSLLVVRAIEGYRPTVPYTASPSGLP